MKFKKILIIFSALILCSPINAMEKRTIAKISAGAALIGTLIYLYKNNQKIKQFINKNKVRLLFAILFISSFGKKFGTKADFFGKTKSDQIFLRLFIFGLFGFAFKEFLDNVFY